MVKFTQIVAAALIFTAGYVCGSPGEVKVENGPMKEHRIIINSNLLKVTQGTGLPEGLTRKVFIKDNNPNNSNNIETRIPNARELQPSYPSRPFHSNLY